MQFGQQTLVCLCMSVLIAGWSPGAPSAAPVTVPDAPSASTPPDAAPLLERLETLVRSLREERQAYYREHASLDTRLEEARAATRHWETQLRLLAQQEKHLEDETVKLERRITADRETLARQTQAEQIMDQRLIAFARLQASQIRHDPSPLQTAEHRAGLAPVSAGTDANGTLTTTDRASLIWQYLEQELTWTQSAQVVTARVAQADGTEPLVRLMRLGHTVLGYLTEDGRSGAWWDGQGSWHSASPKQIESLRGSMAILDGQQVPTLQWLPVPLIKPEDSP